MPPPYVIIAISERPLYYHQHITSPDVNLIASGMTPAQLSAIEHGG